MDRLEQIIHDYGGLLLGYLRRRGMSHEDAEDVLSVVWERTWRHLPELRAPEIKWLVSVAHHAMIDHRRRTARRPVGVALDSLALVLGVADAEAAILARLTVERVLRSRLPRVQEDAMWLVGLGFTHGEIAAVLGLPLGTVKTRIALARGHLAGVAA